MINGAEFRALRIKTGMSASQFCEKSGLNKSNVSRMENGLFSPTLRTLEKVALGLGISIQEVVAAMTKPVGPAPPADLLSSCRAPDFYRCLTPEMKAQFFDMFMDFIRAGGR